MIVGENVAVRADDDARAETLLALLLRSARRLPAKKLLEEWIVEKRVLLLRNFDDPRRRDADDCWERGLEDGRKAHAVSRRVIGGARRLVSVNRNGARQNESRISGPRSCRQADRNYET